MAGRTVELTVAGKSCRVVSSADEAELQRLATIVEDKLSDVVKPGSPLTTNAMLLAAVSLAHDVDEQRARADAIAQRAKEGYGKLLQRIDAALDGPEGVAKEKPKRRGRSAETKTKAAAVEVGPHDAAVIASRQDDHRGHDAR